MKCFLSFLCILIFLLSSCSPANKQPWYLENTNSGILLEKAKKRGIKIAILDSGFNPDFYPLFENETIEYGYDFVDQDNLPTAESNLHGCYISYLIAGMKKDLYRGIDSRLTLVEIRIFDESGNTSKEMIMQGIEYAIASGCQVINMSFGSSYYDLDIASLIKKHDDVFFVCTVGDNKNNDSQLFPASMEETISVCAVNEKNEIYSFSNASDKTTIKAPGADLEIPTVNIKDEIVYTRISGSSYATAIVSGIIGSSLLIDSLNTKNLSEKNLYTSGYLDCSLFI